MSVRRSAVLMSSPNRNTSGRARCDIGGWTYKPWRGTFYPNDLTQENELAHAARRLRTIEINSTFYRPQKPETFARWAGQTPADFVFLKRRAIARMRALLVMYPTEVFGSEARKQRYLPRLARGECVGGFGVTEPEAGSNPDGMASRAVIVQRGWISAAARATCTAETAS